MTAAGFPDVLVQCAFTSDYTDTTPTWEDLSGFAEGFSCELGREGAESSCDPGTLTVTADNTDGELDPDNASGPYYGYLRPLRRTRVVVTVSGTPYALHTGYSDAWRRTWPGGSDSSVTELNSTDRFKLLARGKGITTSRPAESASDRLVALFAALGIGSVDYLINAGTTRTLVATEYEDANPLQALQDVERSDGGLLFVNGSGVIEYQPVTYRQIGGATRARTSQARFGNDATSIPIEDDVSPAVDDDQMANRVLVTDGAGTVHVQEDTALQDSDGLLELDLGSTLLDPADAPDRAGDVLNLLKNPTLRYDRISVDLLTLTAVQQATVLGLTLSDRVTVAIIPPGQTAGTARDQWIEKIEHDVVMGESWVVTFALSSAGDTATVIP